ncbi:GNAT family N-acetyltransferase [Asanoa sp. WMMD1127]|uniref:GNAT family N-acetyltransferase n=1 Tax=Asanoa sp. WMMD1127 TaxID=3016107 RepID=UPI0024171B81|nr:GNAT family N-acetyltransferase [Asanoa sp. WMMD1127]MDG4827650.1 GNAT family N-acetyltransferase [Asanoa sp. WMMD1127]
MTELRFVAPVDDGALEEWRGIHNTVVPPWPLSLPDVRDRAGRNRLELAYAGAVAVGNSTVRPLDADGVATVIARVLPAHRGRGFGTLIHERALAAARALDPAAIETLVLAANVDGLRFARRHGYAEVERYEVAGAQEIRLRLR